MRSPPEVCLVSHASGHDLVAAITSVAEHVAGASVAVQEHAADASSLDLAQACALDLGLEIRVRHDPGNPGFGAGCNALAATSTADWLLFLNPDATITSWPYGATDPPSRSIIGPADVDAARPASHRGRTFTVADEIRRSWLRRPGPPPEGSGFVSGAALLVARHDHAAVGGFDEGFFLFYEDIDFCLRANLAGVATVLAPGWSIAHSGAHSTRAHFADSLVWSYESACRFHRLRGHSVTAYRTYAATDAAARWLLHALRRRAAERRGYARLARSVGRDLLGRSR